MANNNVPKELTRAILKRGVSKKNPQKLFYIFDVQVYDAIEGDWVPFKIVFLSEFEGRALRHLGFDLTLLESKEVESEPVGE